MAEELELRYRGDVQKLTIEPGDRLLVTVDVGLPLDTRTRIQEFIEEWAGVPVLLLDETMALEILRPVASG